MTYYTADYLHNGECYLPHGSSVGISEAGTIADIQLGKTPTGAQYYVGTLCPGLINAHCHLELSHMHGLLPQHKGIVDFVMGVMQQRSSHTLEQRKAAAKAAALSLHAEGVVALGDICNTDDLIDSPMIGGMQRHQFVEALGVLPKLAAVSLERANILQGKINAAGGLASITPHAPYSVSPELFRKIDQDNPNGLISVHNQESGAENEYARQKTGDLSKLYQFLKIDEAVLPVYNTSSLAAWIQHVGPKHSLLLVHNTFSSAADLELLKQRDGITFLCTCPGSNLYIEHTLPDYDQWQNSGLPICIGTDSIASNTHLSLLAELNLIKPLVEEEQLLRWATSNGAAALGMPHLGKLAIGSAPGLVHLSEDWEQSVLLIEANVA